MFVILPERPDDRAAVEGLLDKAFGPERHDKASYALRRNLAPVPNLSFTARCGDRLVGTVRFWPLNVGDGDQPALLLGPLGVAPEMRGYGIGRGLICRGHAAARQNGYRLALLVGDENYYRRFGYRPASPQGIFMAAEEPSRLLAHELEEGALRGVSGRLRAGVNFPATYQDRAGRGR